MFANKFVGDSSLIKVNAASDIFVCPQEFIKTTFFTYIDENRSKNITECI
jgi:hypothetical protein